MLFRIVLEDMFVIQDCTGGFNCYSGLYWRLCLLFRIVLEIVFEFRIVLEVMFVIENCTGGYVCYLGFHSRICLLFRIVLEDMFVI